MALTAKGTADELESALRSLAGSTNREFGTPDQTKKQWNGKSLDDKLDAAAELARRLERKGRADLAEKVFNELASLRTGPQLLGSFPGWEAELTLMDDLFHQIVDGDAALDPAWEHGNAAEQTRFFTVTDALQRQTRWGAILTEIRRRSSL